MWNRNTILELVGLVFPDFKMYTGTNQKHCEKYLHHNTQ